MKVLSGHETQKKQKYNDLCQTQSHHFTPLVFLVQPAVPTPGRQVEAGLL